MRLSKNLKRTVTLCVALALVVCGVTVMPASLVALPNMADISNVVFAYDFKAILANIPSALVMIFVLFVGDFFAIVVVKQLFGGIGRNIVKSCAVSVFYCPYSTLCGMSSLKRSEFGFIKTLNPE